MLGLGQLATLILKFLGLRAEPRADVHLQVKIESS